MSKWLFDFQCGFNHTHEALVERDVRAVSCPTCGKTARRLIATPRVALEGFSGAFPTAADQWEKRRESHMKKERKNQESRGTYD